MSAWLIVTVCFTPSFLLSLLILSAIVRERLENRDRARHIAYCSLREREREELARLRSGAAWVEAYAVQLDEILALPEAEPWCQ